MNSLEHRLHIGLSLSLLLLFGLLWFLGQKSMNDLSHELVGSRLEHDVESLLAALEVRSGSVHFKNGKMPLIYQQPLSGHYFVVSINNTPVIHSRSLWDQSLTIPPLSTGERILKVYNGPANQELLQINMGFNKGGLNLSIALAEDLTGINAQQMKFKRYFFMLSFLGLILLLFIQRIILRLSFKRLESVCSDIECLEEGGLLKLSENVPAEILPLVQEVNHLLNLLEKRLERSRNALGNLSHALKSPLNLLFQYFYHHPDETTSTLNSNASDKTNASDKSNADENTIDAKKQLQRINQLINRELKRARLAGKGGSTQRFNPANELPELIAVIKQIYSHRDLTINYHIDDTVTAFGDREDMLEMIGNLLDNAGKWANNEINISIVCPDSAQDSIKIIIEDDGQSIDKEQLESLTQRGVRLDESIDGHGLGLSIVKDIVKLYSGTIVLKQSSALGGLQILITLDVY